MGYAELIRVLERLPPQRQAEVFDFAEFLAQRCASDGPEFVASPRGALAELRAHPYKINAFTPLTRDEANAR